MAPSSSGPAGTGDIGHPWILVSGRLPQRPGTSGLDARNCKNFCVFHPFPHRRGLPWEVGGGVIALGREIPG